VTDSVAASLSGARSRRLAHRASALRRYGIVFGFVILFVALSIASPAFLTPTNLLNILDQAAPVGIIALGATLVIISGAFDLSSGAVFALAGVVAALVTNESGLALGVVAGLLTGSLLGLVNGVIVTVIGVNSFVATLASSLMIRGLASVLTAGLIITVADRTFRQIGQANLAGAKLSVWLFILAIAVTWFLLSRTTFGRYLFAVGGNAEAARLSGIHVAAVRSGAFVLSGLCAALAGLIAASRVAAGQADAGTGIELGAIAAVVIGGTSISGGEGAIWRTVMGVLLLALISNGFNILGIDPFLRTIFQGAIIVAAVSVDAIARRES
jgi:ribose transport system permease protein